MINSSKDNTSVSNLESIEEKIKFIKQQIPQDVRLIAVSKQVSIEKIKLAYRVGIRDFAENKVQEAILKQEKLSSLSDIRWHFIGHLQTNKVKKVINRFSWIHSVDSLKLAEKINYLSEDTLSPLQVCLQVKVLRDPNKYGWEIEELLTNIPILDKLSNIKIRGLMAILPWGLSTEKNLEAFQEISNLKETINNKKCENINIEELSMGMSGDYLLAIQAGSTMIRLGRTIFGERSST